MPRRDDATRAKGSSDRRRQSLSQSEQLGPGLRGGGPVTGDDRYPPGGAQRGGGALDVGHVGGRPMGRDLSRFGVDDRRLRGLAELDHITLKPTKIEMG